jgi:RNA polymerase sigma-70 factor, ECF subfamily
MSEQELIAALREGDKDSFAIIYKKYYGKVYDFSCLYLTSKREIEDVVQEVFLKLWNVRTFLKENEKLESYLFIITRNFIFNQFRKSFNENAYRVTVINGASEAYDIENNIEAKDLQEYIKNLVTELSPRQQEIFRLSREEHLTYNEIALRLGISEKTVERHINEALKFLRQNIRLLLIFLSV